MIKIPHGGPRFLQPLLYLVTQSQRVEVSFYFHRAILIIFKFCLWYSQRYVFSSSHVWMWELDYEEGWALKNWYFQIVVLEKTLFFFFKLYNIVLVLPNIEMDPPQVYMCSPSSSLDSKEIKPVNPKRNQPWIFIGRTDVEAEAPIL